jgi:hypothetical protein
MEFYLEQLAQFVGWKVTGVAKAPLDEFGDAYFGLVLTKSAAKRIVWFLRDDEGNGPGSFEVQEA